MFLQPPVLAGADWSGPLACCRSLFDHLVAAGEQGGRNFNAERLGGLKIEDQLEFRSPFKRDVAGFCALENFVHESGGAAEHLGKSHAVAH